MGLVNSRPSEALAGVAKKELSWLRKYGRPRLPFERAYRESMDFRQSMPEKYADSLTKYLQIAPFLIPKEKKLHKPTLRHSDLQPNNIFVSDSFEITGVIDWQHCSVLPLFLAAGIPKYFQNYDDEESLRFIPPKLPSDFDQMDEDDQAAATEQFRRRHLHFFYLGFSQRFNGPHFHALDKGTDLLRRKTFTHAGDPWEGNNIPLEADLIHIMQVWSEFAKEQDEGSTSCPISFTKPIVEKSLKLQLEQEEVDTQLETIRGAIGINTDGWTLNERYADAMARAKDMKEMALESLDTPFEREMTSLHWPFDDHVEE